jgi:hypothetical protein
MILINMQKKLFLSSILIILSFFLWYFYKTFEIEEKIRKIENKKYYIDIKTTNNGITIKKSSLNILIFVDWKKLKDNEKIKIEP